MATSLSTSGPHLTHDSYGPSESTTQTAVQPFLHRWLQSVPVLYNGMPLSRLKIAPTMGGIWTPSNTWFLGPIRVLNPNSISIGAAVFAGLTSVTDSATDHTTRFVTVSTYVLLRCGIIIMQVLIFNELGLKMPIHALSGGFGGILPLNGKQSHHDPQKTLPCAEAGHTTYRSLRSVHTFLHSSRPGVPVLYSGSPLLPSNTWFLEPARAPTQIASWSVQPFLWRSLL